MHINTVTIIGIIGVGQGILLAILLFHKRKIVSANLFLSLLMVFYSLYIANKVIVPESAYERFPFLLLIFSNVTFMFGPLHYLYAKKLISPDFRFSNIQWLHFLPFFIAKINFLYHYFFSNEQTIAALSGNSIPGLNHLFIIDNLSVILLGFIYMFLTLMLVKQHSVNIKNVFSNIENLTLTWLKLMTQLALVVWLLAFIIDALKLFNNPPFLTAINYIALATSFYVYIIGYFGLRQQEILFPASIPSTLPGTIESEKSNNIKYARSGLSTKKAQQYLNNLIQFMDNEKPFINASLTLQELADELSMSSHNLSQVINTQLQKTYFDFINHYRVEEVKKTLADPTKERYTLLALALDAGFNSKSTFNAVFKKHTNMTPIQYKKSIDTTSLSI